MDIWINGNKLTVREEGKTDVYECKSIGLSKGAPVMVAELTDGKTLVLSFSKGE